MYFFFLFIFNLILSLQFFLFFSYEVFILFIGFFLFFFFLFNNNNNVHFHFISSDYDVSYIDNIDWYILINNFLKFRNWYRFFFRYVLYNLKVCYKFFFFLKRFKFLWLKNIFFFLRKQIFVSNKQRVISRMVASETLRDYSYTKNNLFDCLFVLI
jgi:hypothetical protein